MKYEIINPSDKCFITAHDERLAKIACAVLGQGWYGPLRPPPRQPGAGGEGVEGALERINTFGWVCLLLTMRI